MVLPWPITDMSDESERVEELESQVERLQATVQGLTEELVEVHDRLETLEGSGATAGGQTAEKRKVSRAREEKSDEAKGDEAQNEDETGGDSDTGDDIIVA